jgi:adenine phosphoribosyltransferase
MDLRRQLREIPDFPKPGILFYDISPVLAHAGAWRATVERLGEAVAAYKPDLLAGIESRGFIFAAPVALRLGLGFVMLRKRGKLPGSVMAHDYDLEYGSDTIEVAADLVPSGARVVLVDDLIATGGTAAAAITLLRKVGAEVVGAAFFIELTALNGRARLDVPTEALLRIEE